MKTIARPVPLYCSVLLLLAGCAQPAISTRQVLPTSTVPGAPAATQPPAPSATPAATTATSAPSGIILPDPSGYTWQLVVNGYQQPVGIASAGDGSNRLFVLEKAGVVRAILRGAARAEPFLDISGEVKSSGSEQGLLGIAFDPHFAENGFFYVNYTDLDGNTVIARFHVPKPGGPADPGSEVKLLRVKQPYPNHNGGGMAFGPDGYLYLGLGDGGSQGDPNGNGQSLTVLLGKLLRIDVDHGQPYTIPQGNPFAKGGGLPEIWAYGLRNPWRFSFDRNTGDLYIGDVGQDLWEEIDFLPAGVQGAPANFGWNYREGLHPYSTAAPPASARFTDPIYEYSHDQGCAVIGGEVYRGKALPAFEGVYLFGDDCSGNVWGLARNGAAGWQAGLLFHTDFNISSFGLDEVGEVYLADLKSGSIYRLSKR